MFYVFRTGEWFARPLARVVGAATWAQGMGAIYSSQAQFPYKWPLLWGSSSTFLVPWLRYLDFCSFDLNTHTNS